MVTLLIVAALHRTDIMLDVDSIVSTICRTTAKGQAFEPTDIYLTDYFISSSDRDVEEELSIRISERDQWAKTHQMGLRAICNSLKEAGCRTKRGQLSWHPQIVKQIIRADYGRANYYHTSVHV